MSAITIDGDLVHYEKLGRGRPVILVHGWLGSWRYWIPTMQQLHLKYSVYTLDLLGFGDSAKNPEKYSIERQSKLLNQFMDQLGIPKAAMIGHGLGVLVLTRFALTNPERVARMLLVGAPLFDPGNLKDRTPAGTRVLLTPSRDRFSLAPQLTEADLQATKEQTLPRNPLVNLSAAQPNPLTEVRKEDTSSKPLKPTSDTTPSVPRENPHAPVTNPHDAIVTAVPQPNNTVGTSTDIIDDNELDQTVPSRGIAMANPYNSTPETMQTISPDERRRLLEVAAKNPVFASAVAVSNDTSNQLMDAFIGKTLMGLLDRCFKKSETTYDKLRVDVEKTDDKVLVGSAQGYNANRFLDDLRKITAPMVAVHGEDDPVMPPPNDDVWQYLTVDKDDVFVPIPLPNVRHFPMLEYEPFTRLATDFLEISEISKLELRERWRRRSR